MDYGPDNFPLDVNPLTGMPVDDPSLLERRPIAIKVQIFPRGQRPPWGVSQADIVYDYLQNNGLTRFNAIFYGNDAEQVGPIRSARYFDDHIVRMYKSIFVFGGADRVVLNRFLYADYYKRLMMEGRETCPALCRTDPNGFNFLVADTGEVSSYMDEKGVDNTPQDLDGMTFKHQPPPGGVFGSQVYNRYSISAYNRWDYDSQTGRYLRFQDIQEDTTGQDEAYAPLVDGLTDEQIAADNVIVLFTSHVPEPGSRTRIEINLYGSGNGFAFRDGMAYEVQWTRLEAGQLLSLTFNGEPYAYKPGTTWFQVMGQSTNYEEVEMGVWRFENRIP